MKGLDNLNILVVEDDVLIGRLIQQHLIEAGHRVIDIIHNSEKALEKLHFVKPDLVLLDINIDGSKDGIEVGMIINTKYDIPFIFLSALSDTSTLERAKLAHPCAYIVKPYKASDLYSSISIGLFNYQNRKNNKTVALEDVNKIALDPLSAKEFDLLLNISEGLTNAQIAEKEHLSLSTIKWHFQNIYSKLGAKNRMAAVKIAFGN